MAYRKNNRISLCLPVSVGQRAALSADVSAKGVCLEAPTLRSAGDEVTGYVLFGDKELAWQGRVQWVRPGNPMYSLWHRMGIEFTQVSPGLRALLSIKLKK